MELILKEQIDRAVSVVRRRTSLPPQVAIILGSGLGALASEVSADTIIPYGEIPGFPRSTVEGHAGNFIVGRLEGKAVVAMQGRAHSYEGYSLADVVFPVRVMRALGARVLLVSNAAGGINRLWSSGGLMSIADHINFTGSNPLMGPNDPHPGPRFPDMSQAYEPELIALAGRAPPAEGIPLRKGAYAGGRGPSYETPAELRMLRVWGAD